MSNAIRLLTISPLQSAKSLYLPSHRLAFSSFGVSDFCDCLKRKSNVNGVRTKVFTTISQQGSIPGLDYSSSPVSIELKPILNESQFDLVIAEAEQLDESVVILWMAKWCRKCIYLKPKLEKLAADYHPRVRFYCIDVNNVPYKLVVRAGVTKMPTVQVWKNSKKQAEVIGGHKAYLVVNEVREMIENENEP
ncbi:thioredoxin-like 3-2, chloroplastic [Cynara cardunculus var. scolymus]|uniref:Thioredoxin n=1 Tax=Cynara cardunculus var. scolymus TaxID=59895 RepID=A0A103YCX9_CYNCS|nr:thioredoxin-like 3-2, chloroplastic [Cynara cardunculus var. scolymus]KVI06794.1 Thioredoxin [Cynara cardunculus var. scolymus]